MTRDMTTGIWSVVVGAGYLFSAFKIPLFHAGDQIGPRVFPFMISALVIGCGLTLILKEIRNKEAKPLIWGVAAERGVWLRIICTIVAGIIYGLVLDWAGYIIATFFFMVFMASIINIGRHLQNLVIAAVFSVGTFVAFAVLLKLSLPRGILGDYLPF
jgi:putative tricarboxylic transport membrane protein